MVKGMDHDHNHHRDHDHDHDKRASKMALFLRRSAWQNNLLYSKACWHFYLYMSENLFYFIASLVFTVQWTGGLWKEEVIFFNLHLLF